MQAALNDDVIDPSIMEVMNKETQPVSMTQLLSHTFAHLTGPSFRFKVKLLPNKKFLGLM